jgi:hypothetical protein
MSSLLSNIMSSVESEQIADDQLYHTRARLHQLLKTGTEVYNSLVDEERVGQKL